MNLASMLGDSARRYPDKAAVIIGERLCTYAQLDAATDRAAAALAAAGALPGHKVALTAPNGPEFIAAMMGILRMGGVAVPCAMASQPSERREMIERVGCEFQMALEPPGDVAAVSLSLFEDRGSRTLQFSPTSCANASAAGAPTGEMRQFSRTSGANIGVPDERLLQVNASNIRFTSGTTASYKGVVLSHSGIRDRIEAANRALCITHEDTIYFGLQMAHHFAVSVMLHLSVGATIVTGGVFLGDAMVEQVRRHRATIIYATPVTYRLMADAPNAAPAALETVRLAMSTAMPLAAEIEAEFEQRFEKPLSQALGVIEVGMPIINLSMRPRVEGCLGQLIDSFEARIVDEQGEPVRPGEAGELWLRGPGMLEAYYCPWRSRQELLTDGWFKTGDVVRRDAAGNIFLLGRTKHVINVGGIKVFPLEIERVFLRHEAVQEVVVTSAPDDVLGEVPAAAVVLRPGHRATPEMLAAHCRRHLSPFEVPRAIHIVADLPRTHSGKVAVSKIAIK